MHSTSRRPGRGSLASAAVALVAAATVIAAAPLVALVAIITPVAVATISIAVAPVVIFASVVVATIAVVPVAPRARRLIASLLLARADAWAERRRVAGAAPPAGADLGMPAGRQPRTPAAVLTRHDRIVGRLCCSIGRTF